MDGLFFNPEVESEVENLQKVKRNLMPQIIQVSSNKITKSPNVVPESIENPNSKQKINHDFALDERSAESQKIVQERIDEINLNEDDLRNSTTSVDAMIEKMPNIKQIKKEPTNADDENEIEEVKFIKFKTKVEITINDNVNAVHRIRIPKSSVTLNDVTKHLMSQPKKFGMSHQVKYDFSVKTIENGKVIIDEIDDDMYEDILPLFEGKIVLHCWAKF